MKVFVHHKSYQTNTHIDHGNLSPKKEAKPAE
jgi:hypothetical protein